MPNTLKNIEGKQIRLRDWTFKDIDLYRQWLKPGHLWQALDGPYYRSSIDKSTGIVEDLKKQVEQSDFPEPRLRLVIADRSTDEFLGIVSSYWESIETHWLCIGISIYDPTRWGKGIGRESLSLWIDYLFSNYSKIARLDMRTWSGNFGLIRVAEALGFVQKACFRKARIVDGQYFDGLGFGILREEWKGRDFKTAGE